MSGFLSPIIMLVAADPPDLPQYITLGGHVIPLHNGAPRTTEIEVRNLLEYRGENGTPQGTLVCIMPVAAVPGGRYLVVCWVPTAERGGVNMIFQMALGSIEVGGLVAKAWPCISSGGFWTAPYLEVDASDEAQAVRDAWPTDWRMPGGGAPSVYGEAPPPPTGPRCIPSTYCLS